MGAVAFLLPVVSVLVGVWCGIRIERHRRNRELDELLNAHDVI